LVNGVVPHETLQTKTQDLSRRIARNGSLPITLAKRGLQHFEG
jgi:enoyl-CoA hydratase/carnithine racemase